MVQSSLPALALLALSASVAAVPTTSPNTAVPFTISQWIEDIIANPYGDHLTPEEAVAAFNVAHASASLLDKRVNCKDNLGWPRANADNAAACLKDLARKGAAGTNCGIPNDRFNNQMCRNGNAQVVGSRSIDPAPGTNCNDVARTGGLIFDSCWRSDNTVVGSEICINEPKMQINILGV